MYCSPYPVFMYGSDMGIIIFSPAAPYGSWHKSCLYRVWMLWTYKIPKKATAALLFSQDLLLSNPDNCEIINWSLAAGCLLSGRVSPPPSGRWPPLQLSVSSLLKYDFLPITTFQNFCQPATLPVYFSIIFLYTGIRIQGTTGFWHLASNVWLVTWNL